MFETTPLGSPRPLPLETLASSRDRVVDPALRDAFVARDLGEQQLRRLFSEKALCITTGQQPGLFTGPLFTIYKALTVVAVARRCEERLRRPVVPVFWVAGDDHDLAEAGHAEILNLDNELERLALPNRSPDAPLTPLYREPLGEEVSDLLAALTAATPPTEYRDATLEWLARHYRTGTDLATAFAGALAELLGPLGLVVLRPTHPAAKVAMRPLLLEALARATDLEHALEVRAATLTAEGESPVVSIGGGATLVMLEGELGRDRLVAHDGRFHARRSGTAYDLEELSALAQETPERFSPNVLLRPVVEAALLPTLAYVAGPGELAYLPQCDPLYETLGVSPQVPLPRWSARIVERRVRKVLDKYTIRAEELALPDGQLERRLVQDDMPPAAREAITQLRRTLPAQYQALRDAAVAIDPTLKKPVESAQGTALNGLKDLEKRLVSHLKQNNDILLQQVAKARHNLYPGGKPQERVLNAVPYLIRYGRGFLDAASEAADTWAAALVSASAKP